MSQFILDWCAIRPLNGGREKGFEELIAQLAEAEKPLESVYYRKGTPDAGVECYVVLADGSEWAWQAKYIDGLADTQWQQIDRSVEAAITRHPRLVRYIVCVPLDLPDGRTENKRSAKDKWDDHVTSWKKLAADLGMNVAFEFWGSHQLLERLQRPEHVGRVHFWFDVQGFDAIWFRARLEESIQTAGPRYSPAIHIDLPIAWEFEAFGRTHRFFDDVKSNARHIRDRLPRAADAKTDAPESPTDDATTALSTMANAVCALLGEIQPMPTGSLPFAAIAKQALLAVESANQLEQRLRDLEDELDTKPMELAASQSNSHFHRSNPIRDRRRQVSGLAASLRSAHESLTHADQIASRSLLIVRGDAGTGKTHLLCDVASHRLAAGLPTVLLMGQRFTSDAAPWTQVGQQLDLHDVTAQAFVGALEAAAQTRRARALFIIDAINEGKGKVIWPSHLSALLAQVFRSPWIGVVLSVRTSHEDIVIPPDIRSSAAMVNHDGFTDHEYDATKTFFIHYGLELPSTPFLSPEYRNPLFLKTLCQGLRASGQRRLPRGFHGISAAFDLYLNAINADLALSTKLNFNPLRPMVKQALEAIAKAFMESGRRWLSVQEAERIVNAFLPDRSFENSLYHALVVEGVLIEDVVRHDRRNVQDAVFIAYERFADHLVARNLLDNYLSDLDSSTATGATRPFLVPHDDFEYVASGLLEALCIQVPERTGKEFTSFVQNRRNEWALASAFRHSLVWRDYKAFSEDTLEVLNQFSRTDVDACSTCDAILTIAMLPEHPFNARFLDRRLRRDSMPDRDAWWSVYLHFAWNTQSAVDRLVHWASSITPDTEIDEESVELCGITLCWMLTTSNRFLRDRATMALVSLLTGRIATVVQLVNQFADVDDPYIVERVYAVAYGVALRCHDPVEVGPLALNVYNRVFASREPPSHMLIRDYARGVVERAIYLRSEIDVDMRLIRPPYGSQWPTIPTEAEIEPLLPSRGDGDNRLQWGRLHIENSVLRDDFARYVIHSDASYWLSLRIDEPRWQPPPGEQEQLRSLAEDFSIEEVQALAKLGDIDAGQSDAVVHSDQDDSADFNDVAIKGKIQAILSVLSEEHANRVTEILASPRSGPPRFDASQIQRFTLWRVFDLGWTSDRFERFDGSIGSDGRNASKAERIGKKYQWIAYCEIMGLVADHYQFNGHCQDEPQEFVGPDQIGLRDIDPSCTLQCTAGGTSWEGHAHAWWDPIRYEKWLDDTDPEVWVLNESDLPEFKNILIVTRPDDHSRWFNGNGFYRWRQRTPADKRSSDVLRRDLWYDCTGYLIRATDVASFLEWAQSVDFWGRWMPEAELGYRMCLGEYPWRSAVGDSHPTLRECNSWTQPGNDCPTKLCPIAFEYLRETGGYDCSIDESYTLDLPAAEIIDGCGIRWSGNGADYIDVDGRVIAYDPTVYAAGPTALLLRQNEFQKYLARENLTICWAVLGEKSIYLPADSRGTAHSSLRMTGAYAWADGELHGFVQRQAVDPH